MATSGDLARVLASSLHTPFPTVDLFGRKLRAAGLLSTKGHGRGAANMTARDAAAWLVSLCIDHARGGDFIRETETVLHLPRFEILEYPNGFASNLASPAAKTAGEAIASLFHDALTPKVRSAIDRVHVGFDANGSFIAPSIGSHEGPPVGMLTTFQRGERSRRDVERTTTIAGRVFLKIALCLELPQ